MDRRRPPGRRRRRVPERIPSRAGDTAAKRREALAVACLAGVAAALRLTGVDWDAGQHLHPDERFLTLAALALEAPDSLGGYFDTARSPLNPRNVGFPFFVYGTLPLLLVRGVAGALGLADMAHLHLVGRVLAALFDLATVLLCWRLGRALAGPRVGVAAGALMALCVASIQHAHFFTVDAFAACFSAGALLAAARLAAGAGLAAHLAFGACLAGAAACRINLLLLAALHPAAVGAALWTGASSLRRAGAGSLAAAAGAALLLRIAHPYAFAGPGFFDVAPDPAFVANLAALREMVSGSAEFPPAYQWIGRIPVLFALGNLAATSLGLGWALAAGVGLCGWLRRGASTPSPGGALGGRLIALWALAFLLYHASQFVATQRYLLPALPVLAVAAALLAGAPQRFKRASFAAALAATALWALAFHGVYRVEHPRVAASRWIAEALPPGATLTHEHWDDALPLGVAGVDPGRFGRVELPLYAGEDPLKRAVLGAALDRADYVVLSSDRLYGSIPRAPWRYPLARRYYELLFSGALGFRLERSFRSAPHLGPLQIPDAWSEEAFRVYDHPAVHVFAKTGAYESGRTRALLAAVRLDTLQARTPREGSAAFRRALPTALRPGERSRASPLGIGAELGSGEALLRWLGVFLALAAASLALARRLLPEQPELAALLALLLPWLGPAHAAWWLASLGWAPFSESPPAAALLLGAAGTAVAWRDRRALTAWIRLQGGRLAAPAAAFAVAFAGFALLRAANPTLYWGEKPMDLAILGALARARSLPPADPWFAGEALNYFYFGHALVAAFARTCGVPLAIAFNLALATAAGLAGAAAYAAGRTLGRSAAAGLVAVFLVLFAGNLAAPRAWLAGAGGPVDFEFFWRSSRVIEGAIDEFPFWSFLFGDLHAHVLALPLELSLVAFGSAWLSRCARPGARGTLSGWLLGAVAATNPWSAPLALAVQAALLACGARAGALSGAGAALRLAAVGALGFALTAPFWLEYAPAAGVQVSLHRGDTSPVADLATIFGLFAFALAPSSLAVASRASRGRALGIGAAAVAAVAVALFALRGAGAAWPAGFAALALLAAWRAPAPGPSAAALLAALAAAAVLAAEVLTVSDRMNTIFKLHLQAWLLASVAAASLGAAAFGTLARPLRRVFAAGLLALAAAAVSTSVAASIGLLRFPKMASPGPSLDGTRYLAERDPDALAAYRFLNRHVVGVPVVLEGIGRPYGDSLRVAMHTGLPAAVGWEPHLLQQARERGEVRRRAAEVDRFYATTDRADAGRILDRLRADFVFVGPLERSRYPAAGLAKFGDWGRLERVFERGGVALYATPGAVAAEKTWRDAAPGSRSGAAGLVYDRAGRAARELEPSGPARRPRALERPSAGRD